MRDAAAAVADLVREELPTLTQSSRGSASDPLDAERWRKLRAGTHHPYRPDVVDEWVRERVG